jgi:phage tail-like protein
LVEVDGIARAAFKSCSELSAEVANIDHKEGGDPVPVSMPGTATFPEVTLERGVCNDFDLYNWFKDTLDAATGNGLREPDLFRTVDIVQLDRDGAELERYRLFFTYCRRYVGGDWDMDADECRMEQVVIKPRYWERVPTAA